LERELGAGGSGNDGLVHLPFSASIVTLSKVAPDIFFSFHRNSRQ